MLINSNWYLYINIGIVVFVAFLIFNGLRKGFVLQVVDLLSLLIALVVAFLFAPTMATAFSIINVEKGGNVIDLLTNQFMNMAIWFVLLVIGIKLVLLLIRPLIKFVTKLPLVHSVNKVLGAIFGFLVSLIWIVILTTFLSTPVFRNGKDVIENTILQPLGEVAEITSTFLKNQLAQSKIVKNWVEDLMQQDPEDQAKIVEWLIENKIDIDYDK